MGDVKKLISRSRIFRELVESGGSVKIAARALGLETSELRQIIRKEPELEEAALEAAEQALDKAEALLREGLQSRDSTRRLQAASAILRSHAGKRRF